MKYIFLHKEVRLLELELTPEKNFDKKIVNQIKNLLKLILNLLKINFLL